MISSPHRNPKLSLRSVTKRKNTKRLRTLLAERRFEQRIREQWPKICAMVLGSDS